MRERAFYLICLMSLAFAGCSEPVGEPPEEKGDSPTWSFAVLDWGAPDVGIPDDYVWMEYQKLLASDGKVGEAFGYTKANPSRTTANNSDSGYMNLF